MWAVALVLLTCVQGMSILSYGAVPNNATYAAACANGMALYQALAAANSSTTDRIVTVPAVGFFEMLPYKPLVGLRHVVMDLVGTLAAYRGDMALWPNGTNGHRLNFIELVSPTNVTLEGGGSIEGHGYRWWVFVLTTGLDTRPNLLEARQAVGLTLRGWRLLNSPRFHVNFGDSVNALIEYVTVHVDVEAQKELLRAFGHLREGLPTFPLNTDGIDISGTGHIVRHCHVQNFDDSVCVKPQSQTSALSNCSEDIWIYNVSIHYGVGASVGSVPPSPHVNCVRRVLFENITFAYPIKGVYVKPNPCPHPDVDGTGIIDRITYRNLVATTPLTWPIWVSTQQQHQPGGGANTHCSFFYPLWNTTCPTQPCVPVTNLVIDNYTATGGPLSPGVLRCHPKGPCRNWTFRRVRITSELNFPFGPFYLCQAIDNFTMIDSTPSTCVYNYSGLLP